MMTTIQEAKEILGEKDFVGPAEWEKFTNGRINFSNGIPEIPWSVDVLKNPTIPQRHFLFLGCKELDGIPLSIKRFYEIYKEGPNHPMFVKTSWNKSFGNYPFALRTCENRWYLMTYGAIKDTNHLTASQQVEWWDTSYPEYEISSAIERVTAHILFYLLNKEYLGMYGMTGGLSTRTSDYWQISSRFPEPVVVFAGEKRGIGIIHWDSLQYNDKPDPGTGVVASRKIPS